MHDVGLVIQVGLEHDVEADVVFVVGYDFGTVQADILQLARLGDVGEPWVVSVEQRRFPGQDIARVHAFVRVLVEAEVGNLYVEPRRVFYDTLECELSGVLPVLAVNLEGLPDGDLGDVHFAGHPHQDQVVHTECFQAHAAQNLAVFGGQDQYGVSV